MQLARQKHATPDANKNTHTHTTLPQHITVPPKKERARAPSSQLRPSIPPPSPLSFLRPSWLETKAAAPAPRDAHAAPFYARIRPHVNPSESAPSIPRRSPPKRAPRIPTPRPAPAPRARTSRLRLPGDPRAAQKRGRVARVSDGSRRLAESVATTAEDARLRPL